MLMRPVDLVRTIPLPAFLCRTFIPLYHADTVNHCPACSGRQWHIGRSTAECAFCATALPLAMVAAQPMERRIWSQGNKRERAA